MGKDKIQQAIDQALGHDLEHEPDEIDAVLDRYRTDHASILLDKINAARSGQQKQRPRRGTSLTTLSSDAAIRSVQATLCESERLVVADDGFALEVVEQVEVDETVESEVVVLQD